MVFGDSVFVGGIDCWYFMFQCSCLLLNGEWVCWLKCIEYVEKGCFRMLVSNGNYLGEGCTVLMKLCIFWCIIGEYQCLNNIF